MLREKKYYLNTHIFKKLKKKKLVHIANNVNIYLN